MPIITENEQSFEVDKNSVLQAASLVEYFNLDKLKLSGYLFKENSLDTINHLFDANEKKSNQQNLWRNTTRE